MIRKRFGVAFALCAVAALAVGCTGAGSSSPSSSATSTKAAVPALKAAWKASSGDLWKPGVTSTSPQFWTTGTSLIVPQTEGITAYSATDGAKRWQLALPGDICAISATPNDKGVVAVLMGHGSGVDTESCASVAAVDTTTGTLLWTKSVDHRSKYGFTDVAIGPKAVAVFNTCDAALTLSVASGARLVTRGAGGNGCYDSFASNGRILVDGQDHIKHAALTGYDAVTGRRLWSAPLHGDAAESDANPDVDRVISSDPVVVDARINSHRFLQRIDTSAGTVSAFGRESSDSYPATFVRHVGSRIVVQYGQSQVLFDYDATSGREVHHTVLDPNETAIGMRGADVVSVAAGGSALGSGSLAVVSTDPATGSRHVLATTALSGVAAYFGSGLGFNATVAGSTLVVSGTDGIAAYTLPARGPALASLATHAGYGAHDIRPDSVVDLCTGVSAATKKALGFVDPARPAPANCQFVEPEAKHNFVQVRISVFTSAAKGKRSAVALARGVVSGFAKRDTTNHLPAATPVTGIGDETYAVSSDANDLQLARVITRRANVTVYIDVTNDSINEGAAEFARLQRGARLVAKDMIATIDRRR